MPEKKTLKKNVLKNRPGLKGCEQTIFFKKNDYFKRTFKKKFRFLLTNVLLNERFYWTKDLLERLLVRKRTK